jgi:malonyl CoA-acyl carrier protein transacylase
MTVVHLFPGQGSHRTGMGRELFERYPHLVRAADAVLGYSVEELCLSAPDERLTDTRYTQCAVYVVDALSYVDRVRSTGAVPDALAGHSLGEYAALFAAGCFDLVTGLELVAERARLMAEAGPGAMLAVLGPGPDRVRALLDDAGGYAVDLANFNAPTQTVVSGPRPDVEAVRPVLAAEAEAVVPLKVSGAFHSRQMAGAAERFRSVLAGYHLGRPRIPVVSNVTAQPYRDGEVAELLARQLTEPVRWTESMRLLLDLPDPTFEEVGPGQVLTGLLRQVRAAALT